MWSSNGADEPKLETADASGTYLKFTDKKVSMADQPDRWKEGQGVLLECDGEKWLAEIEMTSKTGGSLMIAFKGTIHGHLNCMPVVYHGKGIYRSIIDGIEVRINPMPKDIFK